MDKQVTYDFVRDLENAHEVSTSRFGEEMIQYM